MLFKKTLKVASATALWMVALLGANSAMAQTMLSTYSAEALTRGVGAAAFGVNSGTAGFDASMVANERVAYYLGTKVLHVRLTPSGMTYSEASGKQPTLTVQTRAAPTTGTPNPSWTDSANDDAVDIAGVRASGGALRYVVPTTDAALTAGSVRLVAEIDGDNDNTVFEAMVTGTGTAGVTLAVYDKQEDAHFAEGTVHQSATTNFFTVASSINVGPATAEPITLTASAAEQFKQLTTGAGPVSLGGFEVTVNEGHLSQTGQTLRTVALAGANDPGAGQPLTPAQLDNLYAAVGIEDTKSQAKFYGADGQGFAYASMFRLNDQQDCKGDPPADGMTGISMYPGMEVAAGADAPDPNEVIGSVQPDAWFLCVTIAADNDETIPEGDVEMDITLAADTSIRLTSPSASSKEGIVVSNIKHDGTTVQIPYVTTYENYNQRLVIVNRSKIDTLFTVEFQTEAENADGDAIMVTSDNPTAEMMAPGGQTTVMKMSDLVMIENGTRASATVVIQAAPASVDVATTIVSRTDGSTDTIVYNKTGS